MAKTPANPAQPANAVANTPSPNVRTGEFDVAHSDLAAWLHIDLTASAAVRTDRAMQAYNAATQHMIEAGLLLASVHHEVGSDGFAAALEERGMAKQRAYELMQGAALVARLTPAQREQVMGLAKTKVALLASASAATVAAALEDDELDLDVISVRALRQRIRELEAGTVDLQVQRDTAEAEVEGLRKAQAKRVGQERTDGMPQLVAEARLDLGVLHAKAQLAVESIGALGVEMVQWRGQGVPGYWVDATVRMAYQAVAALRLQADALAAQYLRELPDLADTSGAAAPDQHAKLTAQEAAEWGREIHAAKVAHQQHLQELAAEHEQARPRGRGRPKGSSNAKGSAS
jgi:hypothetical protein